MSPASTNEVFDVVPTTVPFRKIWYPATPMSSVDALQERLDCVETVDAPVKLVGTEGGVVSVEEEVVATAAIDCAETFPAASNAFTLYEYVVSGARFESTNDVAVVVLTCAPFRKT